MVHKLFKQYTEKIVPELKAELSLGNSHEVPKLVKIVVNTGIGSQLLDSKILETSKVALEKITGQTPVATKARQSIAGFKLRKGMVVGQKVTLRGTRMYDFFEKLIQIALPRLRDFRGLPTNNVDKSGNLSIGLPEHTIFPEVSMEEVQKPLSLSVTVVTSGKNREHSIALFKKFGVPFAKD